MGLVNRVVPKGKAREEAEKLRIMAVVDQYNLRPHIRFLGYRPYRDVISELYEHDVFVSPSVTSSDGDTEGGAPVTIIEAAAAGMPVMSSTHCDIPFVLGEENNRYLVPERDSAALCKSMERLLECKDWLPMVSANRRLVEQDKMVRGGRWKEGRPQLLKIPRLMGQTLGFISFGRVARAVAKRAAPFGLKMMAFDPFIQETLMYDHGVMPATLSEVLSQSDFISMHAPARPEVHHMLGEKHFKQMKKGATFINTGRGATVDEVALIKALQEGWIAHAALDVLETEPPSHNNPMLRMENVTLTAHVASASARFDEARKRRVGYELSLVLQGMWPVSCVNPSVLQNTALRRWQPVSMDRGPNS